MRLSHISLCIFSVAGPLVLALADEASELPHVVKSRDGGQIIRVALYTSGRDRHASQK